MKNTFLKAPLFFKVLIGTIICFSFAALFNRLGGFDQNGKFPAGLAKQYGKVVLNPNPNGEKPVEILRYIPAKTVNEVELDAIDSNIEILPTDGDQVEVVSYGTAGPSLKDKTSENKILLKEVESENGVYFKVSAGKIKGMHQWFDSEESKFTVRIPKSIKILKLHTTSGDLKVGGLTLENFTAEAVSGDVAVEKLNAKLAEIKSVSGDLKLNGEIPQLNVHSISGDIRVGLSTPSPKAEIECTSGNIRIDLDKAVDAQVHATTTSGDIVWLHQASPTLGTGKGLLKLNTVSGNITVDLEAAHSKR